MNFDFTDDQQAIKRTAHEFIAARYKPETVRALAEDPSKATDEQWRELADLGWPGVIVPEADGGLGLGAVELVVIQEELGYAVVPSPFFATISAAALLAAAATDEQRARWLAPLAHGELRGTLAVWDEHAGFAPDHSELEPGPDGTLTGTKIAVPDAAGADVIVVAGANGAHFVVERDQPGVELVGEKSLDPTRRCWTLVLRNAAAEPLRAAPEEIGHAYSMIITALAAENVGAAQRALELAVEYAKDRKQFDRPIGSYQAVAHRCSQMLLEVEGARSLAYWAAWALDHEPTAAGRAASMAKAYASDAGFRVTASAIQVHGGIAFTWEHDLHFFLKRAKANAHAFGDARWHRERVAELAGV